MCGIAGLVAYSNLDELDRQAVRAMQESLAHRGPDGEGFYSDSNYAAAMRRLSIIDAPGSDQPLVIDDSRYVLVFNGEIYNYLELRRKLQHAGAHFKTNGDGECILYLFRQYGLDFARHLRGMFALALWDCKDKKLVLARDRFGEKPLCYYEKNRRLWFASELKGLMSSGAVPLTLCPFAINQFFYLNFVAEPLTMIEGVKKLPPATVLEIDARTWKQRSTTYWRMSDVEPIVDRQNETVIDRLHEAVQFSTRSDRPVGIALSGGLDSNAIATVATKYESGNLSAISVGYPATEREAAVSDERIEAKSYADALGLPFYDIEINKKEFVVGFNEVVLSADDPIADISGFGYASVAKRANELGIRVLLFGMGGDELFSGYSWAGGPAVRAISRCLRWRDGRVDPSKFSVTGSLQSLRDSYFENWRSWQEEPSIAPFWQHSIDYMNAEVMLPQLITNRIRQDINRTSCWHPGRLGVLVENCEASVIAAQILSSTYLAANGIPQADRHGMRYSVEARQPLLDHRFVEAVIGTLKARATYPPDGKAYWREALKGELPSLILDRSKKGFRPPAADWFLALAEAYSDQIPSGCLRREGIMSKDATELLATLRSEPGTSMPMHFKALVLTFWYDGIQSIVESARERRAQNQPA